MFIVEVSYGCPSDKYPLNGLFQMDQARALADAGHRVVLVAIDVRSIRKWRRWGFVERKEKDIPVMEFNVPIGPIVPNIRRSIGCFVFEHLLHKLIIKCGKPDIIHVHFAETAAYVVKACKKENVPYVVTEHSSGVNRDDLSTCEINRMKYVYNNAASVIAVSSPLARRIEKYTSVSPIVIPNIIDFQLFSGKEKKHELFQFISAGNIIKRKGFENLIVAFAKLLSEGEQANLLIMGDGPEKKHLISLVKEYGIQDNVFFYGTYIRPEFAEELLKSDCFVLASQTETFGVVYAEALACGIPVIATRCGGPEDFVDKSNGILVDVNDIEGLKTAMGQMYKNIKDYDSKEISKNTFYRFSSGCIAEKIGTVLQNCIKR